MPKMPVTTGVKPIVRTFVAKPNANTPTGFQFTNMWAFGVCERCGNLMRGYITSWAKHGLRCLICKAPTQYTRNAWRKYPLVNEHNFKLSDYTSLLLPAQYGPVKDTEPVEAAQQAEPDNALVNVSAESGYDALGGKLDTIIERLDKIIAQNKAQLIQTNKLLASIERLVKAWEGGDTA